MKNPDQPDVLAGISPQVFMRDYWQKKPLLIRQAIPNMQPLITRQALFELAAQSDVESRLVTGDGVQQPWQLRTGPFKPRQLSSLKLSPWTLLVQGADFHSDALAQLRKRFRFIPDARLDDVMGSYASDGGGVGPHFDSYDVFLLQAHGQRSGAGDGLAEAGVVEQEAHAVGVLGLGEGAEEVGGAVLLVGLEGRG